MQVAIRLRMLEFHLYYLYCVGQYNHFLALSWLKIDKHGRGEVTSLVISDIPLSIY